MTAGNQQTSGSVLTVKFSSGSTSIPVSPKSGLCFVIVSEDGNGSVPEINDDNDGESGIGEECETDSVRRDSVIGFM